MKDTKITITVIQKYNQQNTRYLIEFGFYKWTIRLFEVARYE